MGDDPVLSDDLGEHTARYAAPVERLADHILDTIGLSLGLSITAVWHRVGDDEVPRSDLSR